MYYNYIHLLTHQHTVTLSVTPSHFTHTLTQAQRATLEALETFGGSGLSALAVRKVDLRAQLKEEERSWRKREGQEEEVDVGLPPAKKTRYCVHVLSVGRLLA